MKSNANSQLGYYTIKIWIGGPDQFTPTNQSLKEKILAESAMQALEKCNRYNPDLFQVFPCKNKDELIACCPAGKDLYILISVDLREQN